MIHEQLPTIKISEEAKASLDSLKVIPREPYDSVIKRLINKGNVFNRRVKQ